jgi:hypothetical protein
LVSLTVRSSRPIKDTVTKSESKAIVAVNVTKHSGIEDYDSMLVGLWRWGKKLATKISEVLLPN